MGWTAKATITSVNAVGAVTLQATADTITSDGDDQVAQVDVTVKYADASHLSVGQEIDITGSC